MNKLEKKIKEDSVNALKNKEELKISVLRMLLADIKNLSIEKRDDLSNEEVQVAIKSAIKKRKDSIISYQAGGRDELVKKEKNEIKILEDYLPEQMSEGEIVKIVKEVIDSMGEVSSVDFGKIMGAVMNRLKGQADGNLVKEIVEKNIS